MPSHITRRPSPIGAQPAGLDRRTLLLSAGAAVLLAACGGNDAASTTTTASAADGTTSALDGTGASAGAGSATSAPTTTSASAETSFTAADFEGLGTCRLLPEKTAGPFPLDEQLVRRDVTEGVAGRPMRLGLRVVDANCAPVPGAAVEIWHCDATGDYSAFRDNGGGKDEGPGTTFLRGTQIADDAGIVEFASVVPGWYPGRAVHVHLRVHLDDEVVRTSQLFFDADHLAAVYAAEPYAEYGMPDTSNAADAIAGDPAAEGTLLHTTDVTAATGPATVALANLGITA